MKKNPDLRCEKQATNRLGHGTADKYSHTTHDISRLDELVLLMWKFKTKDRNLVWHV